MKKYLIRRIFSGILTILVVFTMNFMLVKAAPGTFRHQMMPDHANHHCLHLDAAMAACLQEALAVYPEMARQLTAFRETGAPLGDLFDPAFHE